MYCLNCLIGSDGSLGNVPITRLVILRRSQAAPARPQLQDALHESIYTRNKCEHKYSHAEESHLVSLAESIMIFGTLKPYSKKQNKTKKPTFLHNFALTSNINTINVLSLGLYCCFGARFKVI